MARKHEKAEIDGDTFNITQLGAVEGRRMLVKLSKALAPVLGDLGKHEKLDEGSVMSALSAAFESLDASLVDELCDVFANNTLVRYQEQFLPLKDRFDDHFAGRYASLLKWLFAHLKLNFADFLGGSQLTGALSAIRARTTGSPSQTATPTSGGSP